MPEAEMYMARALELATSSLGLASPNPQVGCVIARGERVLGEGAHLYDARDHAEIVALKQAAATGEDVRGATAFVTLEPCSHFGRTGPCADALIAAGIARCVVATLDPNPQVSGRGIARMQAAGMAVESGLFETEARRLNDAFACSITEQRPFVTLKAGLSGDGRLAPLPAFRSVGEPFWLTGPESRAEVQRMRHASDAVLAGIGTVLADDPLLTDRSGLPRRRPLLRVILDSHLRTPLAAKLVRHAQDDLWIVHRPGPPHDRAAAFRERGVKLVAASGLAELLGKLHAHGILSLLLESGSELNGAFLQHELVDRAVLFYSETELGPQSLPFARGFRSPFALEQRMLSVQKRAVGKDVCVSGLLHDPWAALDATPPPTPLS